MASILSGNHPLVESAKSIASAISGWRAAGLRHGIIAAGNLSAAESRQRLIL